MGDDATDWDLRKPDHLGTDGERQPEAGGQEGTGVTPFEEEAPTRVTYWTLQEEGDATSRTSLR